MREIKFSGKRLDNGEWVYGDLNHDADGTVCVNNRVVDPATIGQYTGLQDKNGQEIYEGDIVNASSAVSRATCQVKWDQGACRFFLYRGLGGINWNLSGGGPDYQQETVEVIGNTTDNPELIPVNNTL